MNSRKTLATLGVALVLAANAFGARAESTPVAFKLPHPVVSSPFADPANTSSPG